MVTTSEALGTCVNDVPRVAVRRPVVELTTCWWQIQLHNHYATKPHKQIWRWLQFLLKAEDKAVHQLGSIVTTADYSMKLI